MRKVVSMRLRRERQRKTNEGVGVVRPMISGGEEKKQQQGQVDFFFRAKTRCVAGRKTRKEFIVM